MVDTAVRSSPEPATKVLFEKYELGRLLGRGASAKVYHARDLRSGQSVAIKCIPKLLISKGEISPVTIKREIAIMRRLRHPHIVRLLEVLASRSKIYFVLELAKGGELFDLVSAAGRLSEDQSRQFFKQLVSAIGYCHSRGVFHRDLKPENLLLDDSGDLKVSDFGLSAVRLDGGEPDHLLRTICGTPAYVAPEILAKKGYDGAAADVWSCGVVLFVLVAGYLPFNDRNLMAMYRKIYRGVYRLPRWTSPQLRRLIVRLLDTNPEKRITVEGILGDPWVRIGGEIRFRGEDAATKFESGRELNAFDIISFSSGLDLTGLLEPESDWERFVWAGSEEGARARVEAVGREEGAVVRRTDDEMAVEGRGGDRLSTVGFHRLTGGLVVVEVETSRGVGEDDRWGRDFWKERLRPASDVTASSCN